MNQKLTHCIVQMGDVQLNLVTIGALGWQPIQTSKTMAEADVWCATTYGTRPPTYAERQAAAYGAIFGWDAPLAKPAAWERVAT